MPDDKEIIGSTGFRDGLPPAPREESLTEKLLDHAMHAVEIIVHHDPDRVALVCDECAEIIIERSAT